MRGLQVLFGLAVGGAVTAVLLDIPFVAGVALAGAVAFAGTAAYGLFVGARVIRRAYRR